MAKGQNLILSIGDNHSLETIKDYFGLVGAKGILFGECAVNVSEAINMMDSRKYQGVLLSSLSLALGYEANKHRDSLEKFREFDISSVSRSGGLYVVEQACERGLVAAVNVIDEGAKDLAEVERLGGKCFNSFGESDFRKSADEIRKYFDDNL